MTSLKSLSQLEAHQQHWAASRGFLFDEDDYLPSVDDNLLHPLSAPARHRYEKGRGSELQDRSVHPAKMRALHSSSALVVNVFDNWTLKDKASLSRAFGLAPPITHMDFEYQPPLPTGTTPPNLDVILFQSSGHSLAVESKFTEWTHRKSINKSSFSDRYFSGTKVWSKCGLDQCQRLAESICAADGDIAFSYLDVPQLLKHALGLAHTLQETFDLWYIYYDFSDAQADAHRAEIERFQTHVGMETRFKALTYQEVFNRLEADSPWQDEDYLRRLNERYTFR